MGGVPVCPRCGGLLSAPSVWIPTWRCAVHGAVSPLQPFGRPHADYVRQLCRRSPLPLWVPWPLPRGWVVTGIGQAGDEVSGYKGSVVACSGPNPLGGGGDLIIVAEELGVGLGAGYAGLDGPDAGEVLGRGPAHARVLAGRHPTALWHVNGHDDRATYAGEAAGRWLWLVLFPATAGVMIIDDITLADLCELGGEVDMLPFGALSPRLAQHGRSSPP